MGEGGGGNSCHNNLLRRCLGHDLGINVIIKVLREELCPKVAVLCKDISGQVIVLWGWGGGGGGVMKGCGLPICSSNLILAVQK